MSSTPDPTAGAVFRLPEIIDVEAAAQLVGDLLAYIGRPLTLDASEVRRLGGLGLQVLLSARKTWAEDRVALGLINPSPVFADTLELFGATAFPFESVGGAARA